MLTRVVIFELMQGLKSKIVLYESNFFTLINFVLQVSYIFFQYRYTKYSHNN